MSAAVCVSVLIYKKKKSEKIVERGSRGRQRALSGWRTERGKEREETGITHNSGSVSLLESSSHSSA